MNILLTGSSGFIGKYVLAQLKLSHQVFEYDVLKGDDILDISNLERSVKLNQIDLIFHIAAEANLYSMEDLAGAKKGIDINVTGTSNIALVCSKHNIKLIYASTLCVYGDTEQLKDEVLGKPEPQELYAYTKLAGEQIVKGCSKNFGLDYIILRFATVYGPAMREALGCCIFIRQALANEDITIHGDGTQERTLTHVDDIASGCVNAVKYFEAAKNGTYNISTDEIVSANRMAQDIINATNSKSKITYIPQRKNQTYKENISYELAKKHLNWTPAYSWIKGIKYTIDYYK